MKTILIIIASGIIVGSYFIYLKLKEIQYTIKLINEDNEIILRKLAKIPEEITGKVNTLLKKEIVVKNVLKVP